MPLPPGQRVIEGFPRFGVQLRHPPPRVPADPEIEIAGAVREPVRLAVSSLSTMPRTEQTADLHCVSGWTATGLRWEGVAFTTFFREVVEPALVPGTVVTHLVFEGRDGYRSIVELQDALAEDVLLAEHLDGEPLDGDHGAPLRLVSPQQYGFISVKHLCRIEVHTTGPDVTYHRAAAIHRMLQIVKPHRRARVWQEERHRYLPAWLVRPIYWRVVRPIRALSRNPGR